MSWSLAPRKVEECEAEEKVYAKSWRHEDLHRSKSEFTQMMEGPRSAATSS